jgi:hypothetical protein
VSGVLGSKNPVEKRQPTPSVGSACFRYVLSLLPCFVGTPIVCTWCYEWYTHESRLTCLGCRPFCDPKMLRPHTSSGERPGTAGNGQSAEFSEITVVAALEASGEDSVDDIREVGGYVGSFETYGS